MSTICWLDPNVRMTRTDRASALRALEKVVVQLKGNNQIRAAFYHAVLTEVQLDPTLTGDQKNEKFAKVIKQITQENASHG